MGGELWADLKDRQDAVEAALRLTLARYTSDAPTALSAAMGYSLLAPGKRLRPLLALLACEACGGTPEQALPAACAVEMVHTYSLVHDDLPAMDDDDLRRGLPTCHKVYGEALAILAGDALLTLSFEVVAAGCPPRTAAVSCVELAAGGGAVGMVGGQVLDLAAEGRIESGGAVNTVEALEAIHRRKTGALFRAALRLGVHAAQGESGADPAALAAADDYAAAFGLAFQVTDDLLDVESTAEKTGKRVNKDAARGKLTYPGLLGLAESRARAAELVQDAEHAAARLGSAPLARLARYVVQRDR
ncbi:polyprenyl synthetase family protein [Urbifossiella limnaea]|uniref:Farnesyl diphosphate synthase n=1 Tax=Urbifossiella limnaea TaxID=2528023 RepID=A0A517XXP4_9BACT|nr:farnesyl diphosphate synthase [Urbifossiella limnaea]QDU22254.1 Farnesyl diphosphate synthase [Urbifossiella limnaea]